MLVGFFYVVSGGGGGAVALLPASGEGGRPGGATAQQRTRLRGLSCACARHPAPPLPAPACPQNKWWYLAISVVVALLFSAYLVYDIQMVMGKGRYALSPDEYVFASVQIYMDIIIIFLQACGARKGGGDDWLRRGRCPCSGGGEGPAVQRKCSWCQEGDAPARHALS